MSAIGTVGAVVLALSIALIERRRDRSIASMAQARRITAWLDIGLYDDEYRVRLLIRNSSDAAATRFVAEVVDLSAAIEVIPWIRVNGVPPTAEPVIRPVGVPLPPRTETVHYELETLEFVDSAGITWRRSFRDGTLLRAGSGRF
jgi:hypothetical protein